MIEPFRELVLYHVLHQLPPDEFLRFRDIARDCERWIENLDDSRRDSELRAPAAVIDAGLQRAALPIDLVLDTPLAARRAPIGRINGTDVWYVPRAGIYLATEPAGYTLMMWLTHPAYPPGW